MPWEPLPGSRSREPRPVADSLDLAARGLGAPSARAASNLLERWPEIVGEQVAGHCSPTQLRDGVLVIGVDDPAWATQLRFLQGDLLERVRAALGEDAVSAVEIAVRPPR